MKRKLSSLGQPAYPKIRGMDFNQRTVVPGGGLEPVVLGFRWMEHPSGAFRQDSGWIDPRGITVGGQTYSSGQLRTMCVLVGSTFKWRRINITYSQNRYTSKAFCPCKGVGFSQPQNTYMSYIRGSNSKAFLTSSSNNSWELLSNLPEPGTATFIDYAGFRNSCYFQMASAPADWAMGFDPSTFTTQTPRAWNHYPDSSTVSWIAKPPNDASYYWAVLDPSGDISSGSHWCAYYTDDTVSGGAYPQILSGIEVIA